MCIYIYVFMSSFICWSMYTLCVLAHVRPYQTCYYRRHPTSAPTELGGEIHNVSRDRDRTQVLPQAQKLHGYGSSTFGAFLQSVNQSVVVCHRDASQVGSPASPREKRCFGRRAPGLRPIHGLRVWISEGLTQADSQTRRWKNYLMGRREKTHQLNS